MRISDWSSDVCSSDLFGALRLVRDFNTQDLGLMLTRVDRPYLDREATVIGVDHNWRPSPRWNIRTRLFGSQIRQPGQDSDDLGATIWADYERSEEHTLNSSH